MDDFDWVSSRSSCCTASSTGSTAASGGSSTIDAPSNCCVACSSSPIQKCWVDDFGRYLLRKVPTMLSYSSGFTMYMASWAFFRMRGIVRRVAAHVMNRYYT